jgi:diguanylate cyclase (GGDEF)-like protein/PAS domain S-box-containing protein
LTEPVRILLIDDDEDELLLTRSLLSEIEDGRRFHLDWESEADDGLAAMVGGTHDLYLLDYHLGGRDGLELLREAVCQGCRKPVIVLTGQGDRQTDLAAMEAGAMDFLLKGRVDAALLERSIRYSLERARTLEALRRSEERYALAARGANDGLWDWDLSTDDLYLSPRWKETLGYADEEVRNRPAEWLDRVHPDDLQALRAAIDAHLAGDTRHFEHEHRLLHRDGGFRWILARGLAVRDDHGRPCRIAGSSTDITDRKVHDGLTGLPNRALFLDRVSSALLRGGRRPDHRFAVLYLDLDRFKIVNDSLGHAAGDRLLIEVGRRLTGCVRPSDTVARLGGDEFAVLLEEIFDISDAIHAAQRIEERLAAPFELAGREVFASASLGIALATGGDESAESILHDADAAMYRAKRGGRTSYEIFDQEMRAIALARLQLESDLRRAIERDQLGLMYQPIFSLTDERVVGLEALVRWNHPEWGEVLPDDFIPVAEEIGLIFELGEWVLEEACGQMIRWDETTTGSRDCYLSVNLSARQLLDPSLPRTVAGILARQRFPPGRLRLEVTESNFIENVDDAIDVFEELRAIGVRFCLDDFGKGHSSMSSLQRFPLDVLKIDRSFVSPLEGERSTEITRTLVLLAHSLGMEAVAEGVETTGQHHRLQELACDCAQGFFLAPPLAESEVRRLLAG